MRITLKNRLLFSLILLGQIAFSQSGTHLIVPGTKCSLIPPAGFTAASNFSGFQNAETGSSIMVNEIPAPYQTLADGFTADALKGRGMTLLNKETIYFNNSKATFIILTQASNGIVYLKQVLIFGVANGTVLVNGIYPEASKSFEGNIKEALLSTIYNASQNDNPLDAASFSVDVKDTDFKLIKYLSGSLLYSTDGKIPTEKPTLIVGNSIAKITIENQRKYAEERLKKLPRGEFNIIKEIKEITIDNLKGYEIIAEGKTAESNPELVYLVMLFNGTGEYFIIIGQAKEDFGGNEKAFRIISRTFRRK